MIRYTAYLPWYASVKVTLEVDEPITDPQELRERLVDEGDAEDFLCYHCAVHVEMCGPADISSEEIKNLDVFEDD